MPMQMPGPGLGMCTPTGEGGYTQDNTVVNGNGQTAHTENMNAGNQPVQAESGGPSENGQLYS